VTTPRTRRYESRTCAHCGATFTCRADTSVRFCGRSCSAIATLGKGGICYNKAMGRWVICCRDRTLLLYYRGVMAAHVGRLLRSDELVHHINEDPADDRIENLQIMTRAEHVRHHKPRARA
jgi:hypothetical protein